jgi:hypothetical protein
VEFSAGCANLRTDLSARRGGWEAGDAVSVDDVKLKRRPVRRLFVEDVLDVAAEDFADRGG